MAEDVVPRLGVGNSEEELLAAQVSVQIGVSWAMGYEKVNIGWDSDRSITKVGPCRDAIELDGVELQSFVLQIDDPVRNQIPRSCRLLVEDTVMVARDEYAEFGWDSRVPGEEVLQIRRVEAFASISGTDEDVGIVGYGEPPIHPVCVGECKDLMVVVLDCHRSITGSAQNCLRPQFLHLNPAQTASN